MIKKGLRKASWEQNEMPLGNGLHNVVTLTPEINDFWQAVGEGFQDPLGIPFTKAGVFTIFYNWAEKRRNKYQERKKNDTREDIENEESRMKKMNSLTPEPLCIGCYGKDRPAGLKPIRDNNQ